MFHYNVSKPAMFTWETRTAKFLHVEFSPTHIFRIKIDKKHLGADNKGGKEQ